MGKNSKIEWTTHTFSPWWGCQRVSPGCTHCYAETLSKRYGHKVWGPAKTTERRLFGGAHWNEPFKWDKEFAKAGTRARVFCASMGDVFEEHPQLIAPRHQLWCLIDSTPNLDWLLLTKRPENVMDMVPPHWRDGFPLNVWLGTSVEDRERAAERIPILLNIPAHLRFLSCEPLLERITLAPWVNSGRLHWVIVGGESGAQARPFSSWWASAIQSQCAFAGVPFFLKELGTNPTDSTGRPIKLVDWKGADWDEWTGSLEHLRVRDWPQSPALSTETVLRDRSTVQSSVRADVNQIVWGVAQ